jgi:hypothetical protein
MDQNLSLFWRGLLSTAGTQSGFEWDVWFLDFNDRPIAYVLVMKYKETAFIAKTSFDERYKKLYPGIYIVNVAIRDIFHQGQVRTVDFLTNLPFETRWKPFCVRRIELLMCRKEIIPTMLASILMSTFAGKLLDTATSVCQALSPRFHRMIVHRVTPYG